MKKITSYENKKAGSMFFAFLLTLILCVTFPFYTSAQTYSGPFVITKGGTYTGNWESKNTEIPAVEVRTSEPVIIENSNIRGAGYLIKSWGHHANITVRHTNGYGLTPTPWSNYMKPRRFLALDVFKNAVVENCYMEGTAGIYLGVNYTGNNTPSETIRIRYNKVKNIDGRVYNGKDRVQFVQFNFRNAVKNVEIAWNQVINEPNNSAVEDNINLFNAQGTSDSPLRIHNNFIKGAYPYPASTTSYSGGGIISDATEGIATATRHVDAYENHLVNLGNYSMGIAAGNNIRYHHNRAVNSATFDNGTRFPFYTSGFWSEDYYKQGTTFNNSIDNNEIGITAWGYPNNRHDSSPNQWASYVNNISLPGLITLQTEADEFTRWEQKLSRNGIVIGPNGSTAAPAPVASTAPAPTITTTTTSGTTGKLTLDFWASVHGGITSIPVNQAPTKTSAISTFEAPSGQGNTYGQRINGYVTAPVSGQYTFWIAADDMAELYLSTSEDPARKTRIAYSNSWTGSREWTKHSTQQSVKITLEAGKRYYIEALYVQGGGGDNLAVGWQLPNGTLERPIAGNRLSQLGSTAPAPVATTEPAPTAPAPTTTTTTSVTSGKITLDFWSNVYGTSVTAVPVTKTPTKTSALTSFEAPSGQGNNYGQRIKGYVTAPVSGQYTFWIAADDMAELYLSTSEDPARKTRIAYSNSWTGSREWTKHSTQQSVKITLEAGKRYYIEALYVQGGGGDNLAVGWQLPNGTLERPIAGNRLSEIGSVAITTSAPAPTTTTITAAAGKITLNYWASVHGDVTSIPVNQTPTKASELTIFEAPSGQGNNYGQRINGYVTAPVSGQYTFWIAADDMAELYLSTSEDPARKTRIAYSNSWTGSREWTKHSTQQSVKITLEAGKRYYIEALYVQGGGGDNLAVGWQLPNGTLERPIAGKHLSPMTTAISATSVNALSAISFTEATAYPNPFRDVVTLDLGKEEVKLTEVVILNQSGQVVHKVENLTLSSNKLEIDLSGIRMASGMYFLKYTDDKGNSQSIKIIKE